MKVPIGDGGSLLFTAVPHAGQHDEDGLTAGLEGTEECSQDDHSGEVLSGCVESEDAAPDNDVEAEILCNWDSLDDPVCRILDCKHSQVDTCCQP